MAITHDQALAFVAALLDSKPMRFHFEAILGFARVPARVTDFESQNAETLDRCEELLEHITDCVGLLTEGIRNRPRQSELDLGGGEKGKGGKKS